jgi:hypothetical protein
MNIMHKNDHQIRDFDVVLDKRYGKHGTSERAKFDEEAYTFYKSQVSLDARKQSRLTQTQSAERTGADKSYISSIE